MLSCLPLLFALLVARRAHRWLRGPDASWNAREVLIIAAIAVAAWGGLGAEVLSSFHAFSRIPVFAWWIVPIVVLAVTHRAAPPPADRIISPRTDSFPRGPVIVIAAILALTLPIAFLTPPTTWDGIGYHLPRQIYWIQNHSVSLYASGDLRQLEMPPLVEYLGAQLMLLSGTDHQANMIQWFAYVLTAVAASVIARDLGAGPRGQVLAGLLALLNPAAATQAVNPKNDIVLSLWILMLIGSAIRIWNARRCSWAEAVLIGMTLGLAMLTKGTAFAFALPVCILIGLACLRADARRAVPLGAAMILIASAINTPHWVRNYRVFGSPMGLSGEKGGFSLANTSFSPAAIASNCIRNLTLHTSTAVRSLDGREQKAVEALHHALGLDPSDPRTTIRNQKYTVIPRWFSDGASGAPVHLLLAAGMAAAICFRKWRPPVAWPAYLIPVAGALIFATIFKWQPWHARLHIPIVAAAAPFLAVWCERHRVLTWCAIVPAFAIALAGVLWNEAKPIVGPNSVLHQSREQILFQTQPGKLPDAQATIELLAKLKPSSVALEIERATCEYPVQRMILDRIRPSPRLRVLRRLVGPSPESKEPPPEAAMTLYPGLPCLVEDVASGAPVRWVSGVGRFRLYVPVDRFAEARRLLPLPSFYGWDSEEGLRYFEGPYPQMNLPVVRWADKPVMNLGFQSDGNPMVLLVECRRNERQDQAMEVKLNGQPILRHEFGAEPGFLALRVPLDVRLGSNGVTISFANMNQPSQPLAVLFRRLQIIPVSWPESQETRRGSPPP